MTKVFFRWKERQKNAKTVYHSLLLSRGIDISINKNFAWSTYEHGRICESGSLVTWAFHLEFSSTLCQSPFHDDLDCHFSLQVDIKFMYELSCFSVEPAINHKWALYIKAITITMCSNWPGKYSPTID